MDRPPRASVAFALGALLAGLGVVLGAFGAHVLAALPAGHLAWWHTGTQYLFVAAFGVMLDGLHQRSALGLRRPAALLGLGATFFSGSLYAMALGGPRWLGLITPLGGLAPLAGFGWLGVRAWRSLAIAP
jgi:uncharacterized membrane protein YgdD (TMEM256/DUF423 family)